MNFIVQLRSNYRLRVGLALILGIVWLSLLLDLHDQNGALQDRYRQVASQLARVDSQQKQTQWLTRAQEAKDALAGVEARLWQNPTVGLTQAQLRDSLLQQLLQAKAVHSAGTTQHVVLGHVVGPGFLWTDAQPHFCSLFVLIGPEP